jgi:hypothetical protein
VTSADLCYTPATELARLIRSKTLSPVEVIRPVLEPFNFTGQPAASVPVGFTPAGLPVGLQIVGRRFADLTVLQASAAYEAARPWASRRPALD